jgi:hypothetical protein
VPVPGVLPPKKPHKESEKGKQLINCVQIIFPPRRAEAFCFVLISLPHDSAHQSPPLLLLMMMILPPTPSSSPTKNIDSIIITTKHNHHHHHHHRRRYCNPPPLLSPIHSRHTSSNIIHPPTLPSIFQIFSDNAFSIVPGEIKSMSFTPSQGASCDVAKLQTELTISSLRSLLPQ